MPQQEFRVEKLIAIDKYILVVYYTTAHCYQFSIIDEVGKVYSFDLACYSLNAAEQGGRTAIKVVSKRD